jgi:hypothetical protein
VSDQTGAVKSDMLYDPWAQVSQSPGEVDSHLTVFQQTADSINLTRNGGYLNTTGLWLSLDAPDETHR